MRPVEKPTESPGSHGGTRYNHPAFGQISLSRVSGGGTVLYGSDFRHNGFVKIDISHSELERDLSQDWYYDKKEIVEVWLSEAQWATFVSSMGVGGGVPCTISHLQGEMLPAIPLVKEEQHFKEEVQQKLDKSIEYLKKLRIRVEETSSGLSKWKQAALIGPIDQAIQELRSNLPFVVKSFDERVEEKVEAAKVEIHGYMAGVLMRAGALQVTAQNAPLALDEPTKKAWADPRSGYEGTVAGEGASHDHYPS